ncbi:SDR family NAD(P)-dependent oxidoreductase [Streptomyces cucumeris]|uniref:SDR family NAD(P)-dependent oxidoreductase n=1 Tax=Streptomyces cucumeris TaxID=2962890 RepID=UPI003D70AEA9
MTTTPTTAMSPGRTSLEGRVAVVTGAGAGIGAAVAERLAAEGAAVLIADINPETGAAVADGIARAGGTALARPADIGDPDAPAALVAEAVRAFGRLDILVNNAQSYPPAAPLAHTLDGSFEQAMATGPRGAFRAMRAAYPHLVEHGCGRVINFVSLNAVWGEPGFTAYSAAKGAIAALTRTAAREWGPFGVTANMIAPVAATEAFHTAAHEHPEATAPWHTGNARRRMGEPHEIAGPVAFLASDAAAHITGVTLPVDGGYHLGPNWLPYHHPAPTP